MKVNESKRSIVAQTSLMTIKEESKRRLKEGRRVISDVVVVYKGMSSGPRKLT